MAVSGGCSGSGGLHSRPLGTPLKECQWLIAVFASEAPTITPETVPHSNHQHLSSEFDASGRS
jgi:hypothetical protein